LALRLESLLASLVALLLCMFTSCSAPSSASRPWNPCLLRLSRVNNAQLASVYAFTARAKKNACTAVKMVLSYYAGLCESIRLQTVPEKVKA